MWWFGTKCAGCEVRLPLATTSGWCEGCAPAVERAQRWLTIGALPIAAAWAYAGPLQTWIARCKHGTYCDPQPLLAPMRALLAELTRDDPLQLVAIPPERSRLRARGLHLPDVLVAALHGPQSPRGWLLERLDAAPVRRERLRAPPVLQALRSRRQLPVVLVDDVVTTGQTLLTAAEALADIGVPVRAAICLADARPQVLAQILGG